MGEKISLDKLDSAAQGRFDKLGEEDSLLIINPKSVFPSKKTDNFIQTLLHEEYHLMFHSELSEGSTRSYGRKNFSRQIGFSRSRTIRQIGGRGFASNHQSQICFPQQEN